MPFGLALIIALQSGAKNWPVRPDDSHFSYCYDCDGRHIVGQNLSHQVMVWDAKTGKVDCTLNGAEEPITLAKFLPDGRHVIGQSFLVGRLNHGSAITHDQMMEWDIHSGKMMWCVNDCIFDALISGGKRVLAFQEPAGNPPDSKLTCFDPRSGRAIFSFPHFQAGWGTDIVEESRDGKKLLYSDLGNIVVFDMKSKAILVRIPSSMGTYAQPASFLKSGEEFYYYAGTMVPKDIFVGISLFSIPRMGFVRGITFPRHDPPYLIGWLSNLGGFIAFCGSGDIKSYSKAAGLVDVGKYDYPLYRLRVAPDEAHFVACWFDAEPGGKDRAGVVAYDSKTCKKLWERAGSGVKILPNNELVLEQGDKIDFVDVASGVTVRSVVLQDFAPR